VPTIDRAAVVLERRGDDLRGRGAEAIDHHHQRAIEGRASGVVGQHLALIGVGDLHHRAAIDEQAGELDGVVEQAAAVAAQIEHQAGHAARARRSRSVAHVGRRRRGPCPRRSDGR
jgi:hypothetical protein